MVNKFGNCWVKGSAVDFLTVGILTGLTHGANLCGCMKPALALVSCLSSARSAVHQCFHHSLSPSLPFPKLPIASDANYKLLYRIWLVVCFHFLIGYKTLCLIFPTLHNALLPSLPTKPYSHPALKYTPTLNAPVRLVSFPPSPVKWGSSVPPSYTYGEHAVSQCLRALNTVPSAG